VPWLYLSHHPNASMNFYFLIYFLSSRAQSGLLYVQRVAGVFFQDCVAGAFVVPSSQPFPPLGALVAPSLLSFRKDVVQLQGHERLMVCYGGGYSCPVSHYSRSVFSSLSTPKMIVKRQLNVNKKNGYLREVALLPKGFKGAYLPPRRPGFLFSSMKAAMAPAPLLCAVTRVS